MSPEFLNKWKVNRETRTGTVKTTTKLLMFLKMDRKTLVDRAVNCTQTFPTLGGAEVSFGMFIDPRGSASEEEVPSGDVFEKNGRSRSSFSCIEFFKCYYKSHEDFLRRELERFIKF